MAYLSAEINNVTRCTGCGTCAAMCPRNIIEMHIVVEAGIYLPHISDKQKCNKCGLCNLVCPVNYYDSPDFVLSPSIENTSLNCTALGSYINCYVGYSTDSKIRWNASSGGVVTSLLVFMLREKLIDGAIVTKMNRTSPLKPEVIIARSEDEIVSACGSKYCPVPVNLAIRQILEQDGRFAVVGLPCHIIGFRTAAAVNEKLKAKIAFYIGIFCSHTTSFLGTELFLQRMKIPSGSIKRLDYRGRGWPSGISLQTNDGATRFFPQSLYWACFFDYFFMPQGCLLCRDVTNELADISLGDAWLPELKSDTTGTNEFVTRTDLGEKVLNQVIKAGVLIATKVSCNKVIQSQRVAINQKKRHINGKLLALRLVSKKVSKRAIKSGSVIPLNPVDLLLATVLIISCISMRSFFKNLLLYIPIPVLKTYALVLSFIFRRL